MNREEVQYPLIHVFDDLLMDKHLYTCRSRYNQRAGQQHNST